MSITELQAKAAELKELKQMKEEVEAEINALEDQIKAHMGDREEVAAGPFKIRWAFVKSARLDTTALKKALPEVAARFMKESTVRRFSVC